ncbi:MAG: MFS transporter [Alphaproteobacteria bacterium]|nr:MFS transporter [Alphaproteobacteria bacterium]
MGPAFLAILGVVVAIFLVQVANGIIGIMVPLSLGLRDYPPSVVGIVVTAHSVGFCLGGLAGAAAVGRFGFKRCFAGSAMVMGVAVAGLMAGVDPWLWTPLRFASGVTSALIFMVAESWINVATPGTVRGRVLGLYMISNRIAFATGQLLLAGTGRVEPLYFALSAVCYGLAIWPMSVAGTAPPTGSGGPRFGLASLYRIAPASLFGAVGAGLMNTPVVAMTPLYGLHIGLTTSTIAALSAALQIGGLVLQWPLGWLSDRGGDRRLVIAGVGAAAALLAIAIALLGDRSILALYGLFSVWGGVALTLYALALAHAGDRAEPHELLGATGGLLLAWAVGAALGPALASLVMEAVGPAGLFYYAALVGCALALFCMWRRLVRSSSKLTTVNSP